MVRTLFVALFATLVCLTGLQSTRGAERAERLLPATTKGFIAIPDFDAMIDKWNDTQFGKLSNDPVMKPFVDEIRGQLRGTILNTEDRFGFELSQLRDVYGGEIGIAIVQPKNKRDQHAIAMIVDVRDHLTEARAMVNRVANQVVAQGGQRSVAPTRGGSSLLALTLANQTQQATGRQAFFGLHGHQMLVTDHRQTAEGILARMQGAQLPSLSTLEAFQRAMAQSASDNESATEHGRWFVEPFGFTEAVRAARGKVERRGPDMLKLLANQGFTAVQGIGGRIYLGTDEHDIMHRTFIYAPPAPRDSVQVSTDKYVLAARMLDFPNTRDLQPEPWVPANVTNYMSFNWKMKEAFEYSRTLVNELMGEEVFDEVLRNIETDPNGPQVNIRRDLIGEFEGRVSMFAAHQLPATPTSERLLIAIRLKDHEAVKQTIARAMSADTAVKVHEAGSAIIWEMAKEEEAEEDEIPELMLDGPFGFGAPVEEAPAEEDHAETPQIPNFSVTVAHGHLLVSNQPTYLQELLLLPADAPKLKDAPDYKAINVALRKLGADSTSFRFFVRSDKACQPTYDLLREGRMPESESILGKVLNRVLGSNPEMPREQQLDGASMPIFETIRHYFTPAGFYAQSHDEGWLVSGCLLRK